MAIKKFHSRGTFTKWEEEQLLKIKQGPNQRAGLDEFCKLTGRLYGPVYAAWNTFHKRAGKWDPTLAVKPHLAKSPKPKVKQTSIPLASAPTPVVAASSTTGKSLTPYTLEEGAEIQVRGNRDLYKKLMIKLKPLFDAMEPFKHTVPIFKRESGEVRKFLKKTFKDRTYILSPIKDNPSMVRVHRTF